MCKILISINPEYVEKIFDGSKKYEYRTKLAKKNVDKLIIYCTAPIKKVVGEVDVKGTLQHDPKTLWNKTKTYSGTKIDYFNNYFKNKKKACAYVLGNAKKYTKPKNIEDYGFENPPQSFFYI